MTKRSLALAVAILSAVIFWTTAFPTITWWDSSGYSLAAVTLGITSPPGSLLLTLLGWVVTRIPLGNSPAHELNLFAGVLAAVAVTLSYQVTLELLRISRPTDDSLHEHDATTAIGAALGALTFAFSSTLWEHATKFTPYVLTVVFTGIILLVMVRWWREADNGNAWRWLAILALLIGLDFSVHRTNALILPALLCWILIRSPRALLQSRVWIGGIAGMVLGLSLQLLLIPIARTTHSPLNFFEPSDWRSFWDYVSLANNGGRFLLELWPRKSNFFTVQCADLLHVLGENFMHGGTRVGVLGWLPAIAGVTGIVSMWRRHRRIGAAFTVLLVLHAFMTVIYFNIPATYFRPFDRHYLPVVLEVGVAVAFGLVVTLQAAVRLFTNRMRGAVVVALFVVLVPFTQLVGNWDARDASRRFFARDYAFNALSALPLNAVYFTVGDNDSFPLWYLQTVEHVRPDVRVVNLSVANAEWYVEQRLRFDRAFPLSLTNDQRAAARGAKWTDSTLVVPVTMNVDRFGLPMGIPIPDSTTFKPRPTYGSDMVPSDIVLLDIVRTNRWRNPITFSSTAEGAMAWLRPNARLEGLYWRIVPAEHPPIALNELRAHLMQQYVFRGYADSTVRIDDVSRTMAGQYISGFVALMQAYTAKQDRAACLAVADKLAAVFPRRQLALPTEVYPDVGCGR